MRRMEHGPHEVQSTLDEFHFIAIIAATAPTFEITVHIKDRSHKDQARLHVNNDI